MFTTEGTRYDYQDKLHAASQNSSLHGTYFGGHGNQRGLSAEFGFKPFASYTDLLVYKNLKLEYRVAFAYIFACYSNSGKAAFKANKWFGYSGMLYPINPWDDDWNVPSEDK